MTARVLASATGPMRPTHYCVGWGGHRHRPRPDPGHAAVAITGSTAAGQAVMRDAAETMTRPLLELGGKAAMVVLPDGDLNTALEAGGPGVRRRRADKCDRLYPGARAPDRSRALKFLHQARRDDTG